MSAIIAIGGGEIGRPGYPIETTAIDKEIIRLSGKKHPRLLFIPTASRDSEGYVGTVHKYFGKRLGCKVDELLLKKGVSTKQIKKKIFNADIIYVGGGDTLHLLKMWRIYRVDKILQQAYLKGKILSGVSAGAICWFKYGLSDSRSFQKGKKKEYMRVRGLNLVPLTVSPHLIREKKRRLGIINLMKKTPGVGIALDDYCALEIINKSYRIITSKPNSHAHKVYMVNGKVYYDIIRKSKKFLPLSTLVTK